MNTQDRALDADINHDLSDRGQTWNIMEITGLDRSYAAPMGLLSRRFLAVV